MEELAELIRRFGLEEDCEHIIVPLPSGPRGKRRCFILKRRFLRIAFPDGHMDDFPLEEIIEATAHHPELTLSDSIKLVHKEAEEVRHDDIFETRHEREQKIIDKG